jgi:prevent-host-death family protein
MQNARSADQHEPAVRTLDIRELGAKASEIVREVRETGRPVHIRVRGEVVARLTPLAEQTDLAGCRQAAGEWLEETEAFAQEVAPRWLSDISSVDLVREQRRDL